MVRRSEREKLRERACGCVFKVERVRERASSADFHQNNLRSELSIFLIDYFFKIYNLVFYFLLHSLSHSLSLFLSLIYKCTHPHSLSRACGCFSRFARFIASNRIQGLNGPIEETAIERARKKD